MEECGRLSLLFVESMEVGLGFFSRLFFYWGGGGCLLKNKNNKNGYGV